MTPEAMMMIMTTMMITMMMTMMKYLVLIMPSRQMSWWQFSRHNLPLKSDQISNILYSDI